MDRRSLLAVLLSTAVILIFNVYFMPKPKRPTAQQPVAAADSSLRPSGAPADQAAAPAPERPASGSAAADELRDAPGAADTTLTITTTGAVARFTTRGGGLESWTLPRFKGPAGQPVELVRSGPEPHVVLDLGSRRIDLSTVLFQIHHEMDSRGHHRLAFHAGEPGGLEVRKLYEVDPDGALVSMAVEVLGVPATAPEAAIDVGWNGLPQAEISAKADEGAYGALIFLGKNIERISSGSFRKEREKRFEGAVHWVGARNKYFLAGIVPPEGLATAAVARGDAASFMAGAAVHAPLVAGQATRRDFKLYLGPLDYWKLKGVGYNLDRAVDLGWKIILPLSHALLWLLVHGYRIIGNYGVVIILLSALTRLAFYPMTKASMKSMREMQKLQPEMERLRKKYKDDANRLNKEVMALYKEHKVNPLGGCLPMLLQMPVFIALYTVLANSVELRHAGFVSWISDLSAPDTLFRLGTFDVHVLPILMAATMFWQQKLTPTDPRQAALTYLMPVMMLFFLYKFPSGLGLYWTVINLLSVGQQYLINREAAGASRAAA